MMNYRAWLDYAITITILINICLSSLNTCSAFVSQSRIHHSTIVSALGSNVHLGEELLVKNLGLTPIQAVDVLKRQQQQQQQLISTSNNAAIALILDWLTTNGRFTQNQAAAIVIGHPSILNYDINTNLAPTVGFYQDAFSLTLDQAQRTNLSIGNEASTKIINPRVADFLCESPVLLEYNVKKRLMPRLERVQAELKLGVVDEEILRAIATKTDSRFDEWVRNKKANDVGEQQSQEKFNNDENKTERFHDIERTPSSYVVLSNLQSGGNIGNILRSASIFGCEECVVVGQKRHRLTGDHGSRFDLRRRHIWNHEETRDYLHKKGVRIYGIEIMANASPIMKYDPKTGIVSFPFDRQWQGAAFVMGNEGNGLSDKQRSICDEFLFIPQTRGGRSDGGGGGSSSLNVACAATVILQAYCLWANYQHAGLEGEKFVALSGENEKLRYRE